MKKEGRIKEKRGESRARELESPGLALGPWPPGEKVHLSFFQMYSMFRLDSRYRLWLFSIVEQYFRKYHLESAIITALQKQTTFLLFSLN